MSTVNFINRGLFDANDRNAVVRAFNAVTPILTDKIHIYMSGSRARMDDRELLYLNQSLIENVTSINASEGALINSFPNSDFSVATNIKGICVDRNEKISTLDTTLRKIFVIEKSGSLIKEISLTGVDSIPTELTPIGMACDRTDGNFWIAGNFTNVIYKLDEDGNLLDSFPTSDFDADATAVDGISTDPDGSLWITNTNNTKKIYNVTKAGVLIDSFAGNVIDGAIFTLTGISIAKNGTLWVCDSLTDKVYHAERDGTSISSFATSVYDTGALLPSAIEVDPQNESLWLTDGTSDLIYNIASDITTIETVLNLGLIQLHIDQDNIFVKD